MSAENETLSRAEHLVRVVNPCPRCDRLERLFVRYVAYLKDTLPGAPLEHGRPFTGRFTDEEAEIIRHYHELADGVEA